MRSNVDANNSGPLFDNCPSVRRNDGTSWPVQAGHGCIGGAVPDFWANLSPFYERVPDVPGFGSGTSEETIWITAIAGVAVASAAHGAAKIVQTRRAAGELRKERDAQDQD